MRTTIDKAGRVVIPAPIRERAHLKPGMEVEIEIDDTSIRLIPCVPGPIVEKVDGVWQVRPQVPPEEAPAIDVAALIEAERDRWPF